VTNAYPNPGKDTMYFLVGASKMSTVSIDVYNVLGEKVAAISAAVDSGTNRIIWDCKDVSSGVYYVILSGEGISKKKFKIAIQK
jgi:type IX secretion system substrate protein